MIRFIYTCLLIIFSPIFLYVLYSKKEGKPQFGARWKEHFGVIPPLKRHSSRPVIWIHTVSVGEVLGATPLVRQLKLNNPEYIIVMTTTTATGAEQVAKLGSLVEHRYMPLDFPFAIKGFLNAIKPNMMLIMETELWPNTLAVVHGKGIPISIINARLSERSALKYAKFPFIFNLFSKYLDQVLCQHIDDSKRFIRLGINDKKVKVTGTIKFDIQIDEAIKNRGQILRNQLKFSSDCPIWIAASTHDGEDEQVLNAHRQVLAAYPTATLIIVPRHPERFNQVANLIEHQNFTMTRRSQSEEDTPHPIQVYLADTMGEMLILLSASDICFMGGSLIGSKVGGHNLLEPAALGVPSLIGPSYYNFKDVTHQLLEAKAITICHNAEELARNIIKLLANPDELVMKSQQSLNVVDSNTGAIEKTLIAIQCNKMSMY